MNSLSKKEALALFLKTVCNPVNWYKAIRYSITHAPHIALNIYYFSIFFVLLILFMFDKCIFLLSKIPILNKVVAFVSIPLRPISTFKAKLIAYIERVRPFQVRQSYLIEIAYGNLRSRANRTMITVFGMATGIGIIVYLLSLGYGIERLVISQVASLNELRMIDVSGSQNTALELNRDTIKKIRKSKEVERVLPLISLVGRITYNKAQTDVLVYAVDESYLELSELDLKKGSFFKDSSSSDYAYMGDVSGAEVAGIASKLERGKMNTFRTNQRSTFHILPLKQAPVHSECSISSPLLGYTVRLDFPLEGKKMWGGTYAPYQPLGRIGVDPKKDEYLGAWVYSKVPLFVENIDGTFIPKIGETGYQLWELGCIQESFVQFKTDDVGVLKTDSQGEDVLGDSTSSEADVLAATSAAALIQSINEQGVNATGSAVPAFLTEVVATDSSGIEYVKLIASQSAQAQKSNDDGLTYQSKPVAQALISTGLMKLLGISEKDVINKTFTVSFIVSKSLKPDVKGRQLSEDQTYKVVGLINNDETQFFYVPIGDLHKLGVENYSQLKVVLKNEDGVADVRAKIETLGYNTSSVGDTVSQIQRLFDTLRIVLGVIGLIALAVASLGMFNTLTVSLLERTREIGGMKVIGMVSKEIQYLFLTEAMIMGFSGGIGGLLFGFLFGHITSLIVSTLSIAQGLGYMNLTYIPLPFVGSVLVLSFIVGIVTGLYPAKRARSISALNALRYE